MEEAVMLLCVVVIAIVVAAAIFTSLDVFLAMSKAARCRKPEYFNSGYKPEHGTEFCRAHLVGKTYRLDNRALYLVEIHPRGCGQSVRVDCPGNGATRSVFTEERKIL